jgi:hypothetical protein
MAKMKYGPRFGTHIASIYHGLDREPDHRAERDRQRMMTIIRNLPLHKRQMIVHNNVIANRNYKIKKFGRAIVEREEAEADMEAAVRAAVEVMEFHLTALMQHPEPHANYMKYVNQANIINAVADLRTKCGIEFEASQFNAHVDIAPTHAQHQKMTEVDHRFEQMSKQAKARETALVKAKRLDAIRQAAENQAMRMAARNKK